MEVRKKSRRRVLTTQMESCETVASVYEYMLCMNSWLACISWCWP